MRVLGVWDGHDAGAALLHDGTIVCAINEERLSRRKLEVRFPASAIRACLDEASITGADVDVVAACTSDVAKAIGRAWPSSKEAYYRVRRRQAPPGALATLRKRAKYWITELGPNPVSRLIGRVTLGRELSRLGLGEVPLRVYDHHLCHAAAAAAASGFEQAAVLTIDGVGDGNSATVSTLDGGRLTLLDRTPARQSPGIFFEHVTNLLNMRELEDEGKVMALATYAPRPATNPLEHWLHADGLRFRTRVPGHRLRSHLQRVLWSYPNEQFARMAQDALQAATLGVVGEALRRTGMRRVALSGGVASNIQINRAIRLRPDVDDVFVFPHMGDGGLALGAAVLAASSGSRLIPLGLSTLSLGPTVTTDDMARALSAAQVECRQPERMDDAVAELLTQGKVVMWFQGRMEYGPRALGHRSILARPDSPAVRDRINLMLKRRVWYQPFCPSILEGDARLAFADWKGSPDRFMTMAYLIKDDCRASLAGVAGADGTCRPQIIRDGDDGLFAATLRAVKHRIGIGAVLNTSFNIHGEPLVCTPAEALDVFRRSGADALAMGPFLAAAESTP